MPTTATIAITATAAIEIENSEAEIRHAEIGPGKSTGYGEDAAGITQRTAISRVVRIAVAPDIGVRAFHYRVKIDIDINIH